MVHSLDTDCAANTSLEWKLTPDEGISALGDGAKMQNDLVDVRELDRVSRAQGVLCIISYTIDQYHRRMTLMGWEKLTLAPFLFSSHSQY